MIQKKEAAGILYREGWKNTEIASMLKMSEKTISAWKTEGDWDRKRVHFEMNQQTAADKVWVLIQYQLDRLTRLTELYTKQEEEHPEDIKLISKGDIDALQKLFTTIRKKDTEWSDLVRILRDYVAWLRLENPELAKGNIDPIERYLNEQRRNS